MNKTIIYYGNTFYPDKDASAHRTIGNAKVLREIGYEVILIGCRPGEIRPLLQTKEIYDGFEIYYYADPSSIKQWRDYLISYGPLRQLLNKSKACAVILYNHPSISTNRIISYCHQKNICVYADCTEWYDPKGFSVHTAIKKIDTWFRMRHVNKKLDGIITISSFLQNYYKNRGCKTICVPPLVDLTDAKWVKEGICISDDNTIKLSYVGSPGAGTKDKLGLIITSLNEVKKTNADLKFELSIIGMNEIQYKNVFSEDVSDCSFVHFYGRMPNRDALDYIKQSDFTIFLRDENLICTAGFPTKFSESIACGTPVLTNITSDLGKYLIDGKNGFVLNKSSQNKLVMSLMKALSVSKEQREEMKDYCTKETTFDYHSFVDEFRKMF